MSYLVAAPGALASTATNLADIGSAVTQACSGGLGGAGGSGAAGGAGGNGAKAPDGAGGCQGGTGRAGTVAATAQEVGAATATWHLVVASPSNAAPEELAERVARPTT